MTPLILLLMVTLLKISEAADNNTCDDFQANYNLKDVVGDWYVVAIIPGKAFHNKEMTCCKVEISETDAAGLRWLINKSVQSPKKVLPKDTSGTIVRLRYHSISPFDIWSRSVEGINGCFELVISLEIGNRNVDQALKHDAMMQLHLLEVEGSQPLLVQLLWGRMIGGVIFRRKQGVTEDELKAVYDFVVKLRGPQTNAPKRCDSPLKDVLLH